MTTKYYIQNIIICFNRNFIMKDYNSKLFLAKLINISLLLVLVLYPKFYLAVHETIIYCYKHKVEHKVPSYNFCICMIFGVKVIISFYEEIVQYYIQECVVLDFINIKSSNYIAISFSFSFVEFLTLQV